MKEIKINPYDEAVSCLTEYFRNILSVDMEYKNKINEIRIRKNKSICVRMQGGNLYVKDGKITDKPETASIAYADKFDELLKHLCMYSIYSYQSQIAGGFITVNGGHRVGICGTAVLKDGVLTSVRDITSFNIRIARQIDGCADEIMKLIGNKPVSLIIVSEPCGGKTTILRDIARSFSVCGKNVCIADERGEIAANRNLGINCDVMNMYPKNIAILQAVRSMSPDVIICDEISSPNDETAVLEALRLGVPVIMSLHGNGIKNITDNDYIKKAILLGNIEYIVFLSGKEKPGRIKKIVKAGDIFD